MSWDRVAAVEAALDDALLAAQPAVQQLPPEAPIAQGTRLTAAQAVALFEDQVTSRQVDVAARELKKTDRGFHTIGGAGHENNAVVGALLRADDPAFLHYRSGGFMIARGRQVPGATPMRDALLGIVASSDDPIAQGRHKVWGSRAMWVPPQTSTIASHLPKATGLAFSLARARRLGVDTGLPPDAIVVCSFGDASVNHATALAGLNTARYVAHLGLPMPILFVCEDNEIGISVPTPEGWIAETYASLPNLAYRAADGELDEVWDTVEEAVRHVRVERRPLFLHLKVTRLWGHGGSDAEQAYRAPREIEQAEARDPLLRNARRLITTGAATPEALRALVARVRERVRDAAEEAATRPRLESREAVMAPLAPYDRERVKHRAAQPTLDPELRRERLGGRLPEEERGPGAGTLAACINAALADELARRPELFVFGEDVGRKGGVYGVTAALERRFGSARVFDTLLDETSILGIAQGAGHIGLLPVPEIQYLAYIHNGLDQVRGEAATLGFFSSGQFRSPMVIRVAGLAYQRGFGGHFHNDNSIGALRDIPGLAIACPARGDDAARMFRAATAMAAEHGRVVLFLEPIALYHERDLHDEGDGGWLTAYPPPPEASLPGRVGVYQPDAEADPPDVLLVSYANGLRLSLQAQRILATEHGVRARVLDLRWLNPLPLEAVRRHAAAAGRVLVVDECRATGGGVADAIVADLAERAFSGRLRSVRAADSFVPLGPTASTVLVSRDEIVDASLRLLDRDRPPAQPPTRLARDAVR
jgi:2-oxoisovalerate dehydrogenase E1 component